MTATAREKMRSKHGSALLIVMGIIMFMSMLLGAVSRATSHRTFMARRLPDRIRALAIAEAGANKAYSIMTTDFNKRTNAALFPPTSYGNGSYDADIVPVGDDLAVIYCTGICRGATVSVIFDVKNYKGSTSWEWNDEWDEAFGCAIACGSTFDFGGCGDISSTNGPVSFHANASMIIRGSAGVSVSLSSSTDISIGNNKTIDGDVTAPILDYKPSKVTITGTASEEPIPMVTIPELDLTPFATWAAANGEYVDGDWSFNGDTYTPEGGILYVNGTVQVSSHAVINGSIIANGDIHVSGQCDVIASEYGFALASRDGNIQNTSSGHIQGLVYAKHGNFSMNANGQLTGQVIVKGSITKTGNSGVVVFEQSVPVPPDVGGGDAPYDAIGISAYQK